MAPSRLLVVVTVECLVDLLDGGSGASGAGVRGSSCSGHTAWHSPGHTSWHPPGSSTRRLVQLGDDRHAHLLYLLLLVLKLVLLGRLCEKNLNN